MYFDKVDCPECGSPHWLYCEHRKAPKSTEHAERLHLAWWEGKNPHDLFEQLAQDHA